MIPAAREKAAPLNLRFPATSANLGSGFDAAAIALDFYLNIEAEEAQGFAISATGRNAERCGRLEDNLILEVYKEILRSHGKPAVPLALRMTNQIPLGMGCGSSAAGRLAAICLAVHFGELGWSSERILEEAVVLEGHPDNVAACWLGGFVTAASEGRTVHFARVVPPAEWRALVVLPSESLATSKARAMLPESYSRADAVANIQAAALLGLAFAQGRGDLLRVAMNDRIHQPYRAAVCPMLPQLLPLAGRDGILGVALSGAGPAVLVVVEGEASLPRAAGTVRAALGSGMEAEIIGSSFGVEGASEHFCP